MDYIGATPQVNPLMGLLAERLKQAQQFATKPFGYSNPPAEAILNLLGIPAVQQTAERLAYGEPLTTGRGMTTQIRPEVAEAALTVAPTVGLLGRGAEKAAMAAGRAGERYAEMVVPQIMERGGLPAQLLSDLSQGSVRQVIEKNPAPFVVKHGTNQPFDEFKSGMGVTAKHIYTTPEEYAQDAAKYGDTLITAQASPKSLIDFSSEGKLDKQTISALKKAAKDAGITDKYYTFESFLDDVMNGQLYQKGGGSRDQDALLSELFSKYQAVKMPDATSGGGLSKSVVFENPSVLKVLQDEGLLGQSKAAFDISRKDASDIFGAGAERVVYKDPKSGGTMEVLAKPDGTASVLSLEVPETSRGKGIGQSLQAQVMQDFPQMMGQVSSKAAAKTAYRLGRRPPFKPDATLEDVYKMMDEDSSVNMISPEMQKRFVQEGGLLGQSKADYPQEKALKLAQQRAALPVEDGGLGLPKDNTPEMRAAAMGGKEAVHFSRTGGDFNVLDSGQYAVAPFDAVGTHVGTKEAALDRFRNTVGTIDTPKGSTYPVQVLGDRPLLNPEGLPWGEDELNAFLRKTGGHNWSDVNGGKMTYQDMNNELRRKLFEEQGYTSIPYINDVEAKGAVSYIVPPQNIRSKFAAFDPFRRNEPDLLAGLLPVSLLGDEEVRRKLDQSLLGY